MADNPLRMLFVSGQQECTPKTLNRNAKALKLQARNGPIEPEEPLQELCPRIRCVEDYISAQTCIADPAQFAVAIAFWTADFERPNPMRDANGWLLEAEGLPKGDGHKAELIGKAISEWDSNRGAGWEKRAVATASNMLGSEPDADTVHREVGRALQTVAERAITDFGETIEPSEIELLNIIENCSRLPEVRGLAKAAKLVATKQLEEIDNYLVLAFSFLKENKIEAGSYSQQEIQKLVKGCEESKRAFGLLRRRSGLLRQIPEDRIVHATTVTIALAYRLGMHVGRWQEANALVHALEPAHIDQSLEAEQVTLFGVSCAAIPLVYRATLGENVVSALQALKARFPGSHSIVEGFKDKAKSLAPIILPPRPVHTRDRPPIARKQPKQPKQRVHSGWLDRFERYFETKSELVKTAVALGIAIAILLIVGLVLMVGQVIRRW